MRCLLLALFLPLLALTSTAQTPAKRYKAAEKVWLSHRPDGLTWDDGTTDAATAIDKMWDAVIDGANEYVVAHPSATPKQIERALVAIDPMTNPSFGPPLTATVLKLQPALFAVSVTNYTASTVFVIRPMRDRPQVWRIDHAGDVPNDSHHFLKAWQSANAADACRDGEPSGVYNTCGPVSGEIGALPSEGSGAPRFYIDAVYSKDAGALVAKQTSVWRWDGDHAELLWIDTYDFSLDVDDGVHYRNGILSIIEKRFPRTFTSCNSCFEPSTEQRLKITPMSIENLGQRSRSSELDLIDELFWRIGHKLPTSTIAASQVGTSLERPILDITKNSKVGDPSSFYIGMLDDWSVKHGKDGTRACIIVGDLGRLIFTMRGGRIVSVAEGTAKSGMCHHPASSF